MAALAVLPSKEVASTDEALAELRRARVITERPASGTVPPG